MAQAVDPTRNNGDGTFSDRARAAGVGRGRIGIPEGNSAAWGTIFLDYDNDGNQDLYLAAGYLDTDQDTNPAQQPNALFRNEGDGTFSDLPPWSSGANDIGFGRGAAYGDFDGDGCLDLFLVNIGELEGRPGVARLFRNNCATGNNWLIVRTVGTRSNRGGIGATITVSAARAPNAAPSPPAAARCRRTCCRPTSDWGARRTSTP